MQHQTMTRGANGKLVPMDCPCGEDHGPSLREELDWALGRIQALETELAVVTADRDARCHVLGLALRRLIHLRSRAAA